MLSVELAAYREALIIQKPPSDVKRARFDPALVGPGVSRLIMSDSLFHLWGPNQERPSG